MYNVLVGWLVSSLLKIFFPFRCHDYFVLSLRLLTKFTILWVEIQLGYAVTK